MQVARSWTPPSGPLGRLSSASADRAAASRAGVPFAAQMAEAHAQPLPANILAALSAGENVAVIAELKRQSPSKGAINTSLDATAQVRAYVAGGASAFSILTEPMEFGGSLDDLRRAAALHVGACIRKDFIIDAVQLVEARRAGASAALLIARALPTGMLNALVFTARTLGIEPFVEVRDEYELDDALDAGAMMIGVNNRDLETLKIDVTVSERLLPRVPVTHIAVYESGVQDVADVHHAASCGADVVLVGSVVSASATPSAAVAALTGVAKQRRRA